MSKSGHEFAYRGNSDGMRIDRGTISPAEAVAASSSFPPAFGPMGFKALPIEVEAGPPDVDTNETIGRPKWQGVRLVDGGIFDNAAIEAVWRDHAAVLVSDGGGRMAASWDPIRWWWPQRFTEAIDARGRELQRRWLLSLIAMGFDAKVWSIERHVWRQGGSDFDIDVMATLEDAALTQRQILETFRQIAALTADTELRLQDESSAGDATQLARYSIRTSKLLRGIRTDLDAFSELEIKLLENHGYIEANRALSSLGEQSAAEFKYPDAPFALPHPELGPNALPRDVEARLQNGGDRRKLGRWRSERL